VPWVVSSPPVDFGREPLGGYGVSGLTHLDLDLLFRRSEDGYQVEILRSPAGEGQSVTFAWPFTDLELENFVLKVGRFRARTRRVEPAPVAAAKLFGGKLFDAVFTGAVGECLRRSVDRAQQEQATLRIRLRLSGCSELADLPWELLYDRDDDWFLALSARTPVVRYVQLPVQPRPLHVTLPLRVLVIKSEPLDYPQLDLGAEWTQVVGALGELVDREALAFTELAAATLSELRRALLRDTFHVLHYMGHGGFDQQRGGVLLFTDRAGRGLPVTAGDMGVLLRDHTSMRLAVLNACEAGRTDPADPFAGVADTLVRRGIPAVIAMQFEVSDDAAIEFAPALYGALAAGRPVDAALAEARKAMYTVSPLEWATPVLYLRTDDGRLFDIARHTPPRMSIAITHLEKGDRLCKHGLFAEAETAYRTAVALDPVLAPAHAGLGDALYRLKRYPEAEAACREAIRLDPTLATAHVSLGAALRSLKRYPEAEAACREAVRLDPTLATAYASLGAALLNLKRYPEAEAACREAIRLDPTYAPAHSNLGVVLRSLKRYPEAEAAYREAIRLDPTYANAYTNLGAVLLSLERYTEMEAACREAIRLDPTLATAYASLGAALLNLKRYPEAEAACGEAIRLDPTYALAHNNLGAVLRSLKRYPEAEAAYREAIRLDPTYALAHTNLGAVLRSLKRYPEAEAASAEAARLNARS
jgi:tetratricopeptide (TPR) repeat protein